MKTRFIYSIVLVAGLGLAVLTGNSAYGQMQQNITAKPKAVKYTCPMHPEVVKDQPGECPKCGMPLVVKEEKQMSAKMYICKMHPEVVMSEPGKCPKCGMALTEKKEMAPGSTKPMPDSTMMKKGMKMN